MTQTNRSGGAARIVAIVLMAATALVTLVSGAGTYCAAFNPEAYASMAALIPFKWLYQIFVVVTVGLGLAGAGVVYGLIRGRAWSYRAALITLAAIIVAAGIHIGTSRLLRGKSMPNDLRLYAAALTLLAFVIMPRLWKGVFRDAASGRGNARPAAGLSLCVAGLLAVTAPAWASAGHWLHGENLVLEWLGPLLAGGGLCLVIGLGLLAWARPAAAGVCPADSAA